MNCLLTNSVNFVINRKMGLSNVTVVIEKNRFLIECFFKIHAKVATWSRVAISYLSSFIKHESPQSSDRGLSYIAVIGITLINWFWLPETLWINF